MSENTEISLLIKQLKNSVSSKRRSAAKKLRKLKAVDAGPALLEALQRELKDKRTWETQYQMIMALGESGYAKSMDVLLELTEQEFEATMVYIAIGDAITRLTYIQNGKISSIISFLDNKSKNPFVIEGLIRAIAMLKLIPSREDIEQIIAYGNMEDVAENHRTWIASAAADWTSNSVVCFLNKCVTSDNQQTRRAAKCSLRKEYLEWSIL